MLYEHVRKRIATELLSSPLSLCSDGWSSRGWKPYLSVGAMWLTPSLELKAALIDFRPIPASHNAETLKRIFEDIEAEFSVAIPMQTEEGEDKRISTF
jgi:hypothetical protein